MPDFFPFFFFFFSCSLPVAVDGAPTANNQNLVDDNQNQNLTSEEIEKLKGAGLTGQVSPPFFGSR